MVSGTIGIYKEGVGQVRLLGEVTVNSVVRDEYQLAWVKLWKGYSRQVEGWGRQKSKT